MKTLKKSAIVLGLFALLAGTTTLVRAQDYQNDYQDDGYSTGNVSLQTFYDELTPYGTWIQDSQYGYVWRPDVDQNEFRPYYTNGRWAMTEYGNTWVSNYDWGWAPFHYGRWVINSYRQWIWLPDTNWGPAWVDWRSGDGYYGWAPMAPSININLSFGRRYSVPEFCWNFIPQHNIYINTFPRYDYGRNNVYIRNTTIINNTYVYNRRSYYGGPRMEDIRRATNRNVTVYRFDQSSRPGASRIGGREVSIYRPRPERNAAVNNRSAAPRKFEQGNAGIGRGGRNDNNVNREQRGNNNEQRGNNDNRFGSRNDNRNGQQNRGNDGVVGRDNNQPNNRGEAYDRNSNGRISRGSTNGIDQRNAQENINRSGDQQRSEQIRQQRSQQDRMSQDQQRAQRDVQTQQQRGQVDQQRSQQMEQQRAQRNEQMQQQRSQQAQAQQQERAQRDTQAQQQRSQQMEQQRAQRNEQMQQQRSQQAQAQQQERAQRDAQAQQQRSQQMEQQRSQRNEQMQQRQEQRRTESAQPQQRGSSERSGGEGGGRPSRGGRG